ncbi:MAG: iron-sulfur cluster assembly scaffold protein [Desulfomonilaceae bacterium]
MTNFQFLYTVPWISVLAAAGLIFVLIGGWTWLQLKSDPQRGTIDSPDASAFLRGKCGDSMKISLRFVDDRVVEAKYWTDGCRMSGACGAAAAKLALGRSPEEIADIDHVAVEREVGGLPEEDLHCATLASGTLQEAIRLYLVGNMRDGFVHERN